MHRFALTPVYHWRRNHPRLRHLCLVAAAMVGCNTAAIGSPSAPDIIVFNGHIFTGNPRQPSAQAIAIRGNLISRVGTDADLKPLADSHTRLIDAEGRTVIPGLNDAHAHLSIDPHDEVEIETQSYNPSWPELKAAAVKALAGAPKGAMLFGVFGTKIFYDPSIDRAELDRLAPDNPVLLASFDGHAAVLNSAMLAKVGIGETIVDPAGGRFERDAGGRLTGVAREYAFFDIWRRLADQTSDQDAAASLKGQLERLARYGVTTVQDMPLSGDIARVARLLATLPTPIRVRLTRMNLTTASGPDYRADANLAAHPAPLISVSGTKWVLDGVVYEGGMTPRTEGRNATAGGPYDFSGLPPDFSPQVVEDMLRDALRNNYQLQFHVAGTPAALQLLDAMDRTGGPRTWARRRVRFEHGDGITPNLLARVRKLGVILSQQGSHLDIVGIDAGLGPHFLDRTRTARAEPIKSALSAGVPLALGSDGPLNPWLSILGVTTDPNRPDEAITREQALVAYTQGSAYAEFADPLKGTLEVGHLADIAVLTQDIFTVPARDLPKTRSMVTIVDGKIAYQALAVTK